MDSVLKTIVEITQQQDRKRAAHGQLPTLVVVCGDHGMNEVLSELFASVCLYIMHGTYYDANSSFFSVKGRQSWWIVIR